MANSLVSTQNRVESPFMIVKIGDYTFGHCARKEDRKKLKVTYPNYMESLSIVKVNGAVNTYTISMVYAITETDDPNMIERVISSVASTRILTLSYGDWESPSFIYKEEQAIITNVASNVDFNSAKIQYTIKCTSTSLALKAGTFSFNARKAKPSSVIMELLNNQSYGLTTIFSGMSNMSHVMLKNLIAMDDKEVSIEAKPSINILDYIGYLVSCMVNINDSSQGLKQSNYYWAVYDDVSNEYGGSYFKVLRVDAQAKHNLTYNTYEVDVGYPSGSYVTNFTINNNEAWAILYNYSSKINMPQYSYSIDDSGSIVETYSPSITNSSQTLTTSEANRTWWTQMTQFPLTAKLTIKGLLRPAILMSYVKVNAYFYGHKHVSSGLYIITKQEDRIDNSGYKTTLTLTRISGDEDYA
jgi:hypothetical protein